MQAMVSNSMQVLLVRDPDQCVPLLAHTIPRPVNATVAGPYRTMYSVHSGGVSNCISRIASEHWKLDCSVEANYRLGQVLSQHSKLVKPGHSRFAYTSPTEPEAIYRIACRESMDAAAGQWQFCKRIMHMYYLAFT